MFLLQGCLSDWSLPLILYGFRYVQYTIFVSPLISFLQTTNTSFINLASGSMVGVRVRVYTSYLLYLNFIWRGRRKSFPILIKRRLIYVFESSSIAFTSPNYHHELYFYREAPLSGWSLIKHNSNSWQYLWRDYHYFFLSRDEVVDSITVSVSLENSTVQTDTEANELVTTLSCHPQIISYIISSTIAVYEWETGSFQEDKVQY